MGESCGPGGQVAMGEVAAWQLSKCSAKSWVCGANSGDAKILSPLEAQNPMLGFELGFEIGNFWGRAQARVTSSRVSAELPAGPIRSWIGLDMRKLRFEDGPRVPCLSSPPVGYSGNFHVGPSALESLGGALQLCSLPLEPALPWSATFRAQKFELNGRGTLLPEQ